MPGRNERDTCRDFVVPRLEASGWAESFREQYMVRRPRSLGRKKGAAEEGVGFADYVLEIVPGLIVGVVEAKREYATPGQGLQQAIEYAVALDLPIAIASDGHGIIERDLGTGRERALDAFPTPAELWDRYREYHALTDEAAEALQQAFDTTLKNADGSVRQPRYYQVVAIHRALKAIVGGEQRALLLMATGSGKTFTALQLLSKLLSYWQAVDPTQNRRILYLADRDALVEQPMRLAFRPVFGDGAARIQGNAVLSRKVYVATYQSLVQGDARGMLDQYPPDFFDLVIVDECHRGSASPGSSWRAVLDHFSSAVHLGLTATPKRDDNVDTFEYFGDPVYEYSLRQGIEDGYLAPYNVRRVVLDVDVDGWEPTPDERDLYGRPIPAGVYTTKDFERALSLRARTRAAATYLTSLLAGDGTAKTIVFCVDSDHANQFREDMVNLNSERVHRDPFWAVRIVSAEGDTGRRLLEQFQDAESDSPVVVTTSRMLSTGVDIEDLKFVVILRPVGSMVEFKQIVGRGTRLYPDKGKYSFDIVDFVGASAHFADPGFDGTPLSTTTVCIDPTGEPTTGLEPGAEGQGDPTIITVSEPEPPFTPEPSGTFDPPEPEPRRKYYVDGTEVQVSAEGFWIPDTSTGELRLVEYTDYLAEHVRRLAPTVEELRDRWSVVTTRAALEELLAERGINVTEMVEKAGLSPDTDPFDALAHVAWNLPQRTRAERARLVRADHQSELERFTPKAREVIDALLGRYEQQGVDEMSDPYVVELPPISELGSPAEIAALFGGPEEWHQVVNDVQRWLYSA